MGSERQATEIREDQNAVLSLFQGDGGSAVQSMECGVADRFIVVFL